MDAQGKLNQALSTPVQDQMESPGSKIPELFVPQEIQGSSTLWGVEALSPSTLQGGKIFKLNFTLRNPNSHCLSNEGC
ncbi:hypothetical protein XENTR_v10008915 [Xenopus tropicalis]|nr:hypothetical protein XENTR_v10008915 [Xenopus tropicalis]